MQATATFTGIINYNRFGMLMPERSIASGDYRFGFNGKENDNEVKGEGMTLNFNARIYDTRLGRWLSLDPLQAKYPSLSPYHFGANNPILFVDPSGMTNTIYLVMLPSAQAELRIKDINAIKAKIYENFSAMGVDNINVVIYDEKMNGKFDGANLDESDVAVGLGLPSEMKEFGRQNVADKDLGNTWDDWKGNLETNEKGNLTPNPERSENGNQDNNWSGRVVGVDVSNSADAEDILNVSKVDLIANSITHGISAHNAAGVGHNDSRSKGQLVDANTDGGYVRKKIQEKGSFKSWNDYFKKSDENTYNGKGIKENKFNSPKASDNYSRNKATNTIKRGVGISK